jgi:D-alanyl-D-alanine carboxypeptidase
MRKNNILSNLIKFHISIAALVFLLVIVSVALSGQTSEKELNCTLPENFQSTLDDLQKQYGFPGATAAYVLPNGIVVTAATGLADIEYGKPMASESRMLSASIGKTFVGATAIALSTEGLLDLDAPISRWLGNSKWFHRLPNHNEITLRHLLTHSSGLPNHVHMESFANEVSIQWHTKNNPFSPEDLIEFVLDSEPLFEAGKDWGYTDTGYILIGLIVEEATGRSLWDEITDRFLTPLSLTLTGPSDRCSLPGMAAGYMDANNPFGFPQKTTNADGTMAWHPGFEWAGGGLVSNSRDLAQWGWLLFSGHAMSCSYMDILLNSFPISKESDDIQYGAGVAIYRSGAFGKVYGHGGWIPGYSSSLRYYPDYGISIAFQINTDIGIVDNSTPVIQEMELRLAEIVISGSSGENNMK